MVKSTPVTVFTGFLGAGKTTIILSLLPKLPKDYKVVLLKNEYGDVEVDSQLAANSSLMAISEMLNGCMCCVLVGQMKTALLEIKEKYDPDRVIIETSGSAFPATLAIQIRQLEQETNGGFKLDAIATVIDVENFTGYEDTSLTAKMQAQYSDVILLNKWENVSDRQLDLVIDRLDDLNDETPRLRCSGRKGVPSSLIFGLDSKLYLDATSSPDQKEHHGEVETTTVLRGPLLHHNALQRAAHDHPHSHTQDQSTEVAIDNPHSHVQDHLTEAAPFPLLRESFDTALAALPKESVWRVKGFVKFAGDDQIWILNWAFGRHELTPFRNGDQGGKGQVQLTVMGARGDMTDLAKRFASAIGGRLS